MHKTVSRRLTAQQVRDLRVIVGASLWCAQDLRLQAKHPLTGTKDDKQISFYEEIIARDEALLIALHGPGGVELTYPEPTCDDDDEDGEEITP